MCGIAGAVSRGLNRSMVRAVVGMVSGLQHRGPDDEGFIFVSSQGRAQSARGDHTVAGWGALPHVDTMALSPSFQGVLGHTRLSILDLTAAGHQPMTDPSGRYSLVYNGEIFNYVEIRDILTSLGHRFRSGTDTEVLLSALVEWGIEALVRLNGMWSFALWDAAEASLMLVRDRFGVKPLYYSDRDSGFYFASELRALVRAGAVPATVDEDTAWDYLVLGMADQTEKTFLRDVRHVPPGHLVIKRQDGPARVVRYYSLPLNEELGRFDERESQRHAHGFLELLADSVRLQLRSDVPVASFLSGGLDSGLITSLTSRSDLQITAFSAVYPGTTFDESPQIALSLAHFPKIARRFIPPQGEELLTHLLQFIEIQDEPVTSAGPYAQYRLLKEIRGEGFKVILSGDGADEYTAGYPDLSFPRLILDLASHGRLAQLVQECVALGPRRFVRFATKAVSETLPAGIRWRLLRAFSSVVAPAVGCLKEDFVRSRLDRIGLYADRRWRGRLQRGLAQDVEGSTLRSNLRYADRNSMAHSIELRVPFMDHRLLEHLFTMPGIYKVRSGWNKWLTREAAAGHLPDEIRWQRSKRGFGEAESNSFRNGWRLLAGGEVTGSGLLDEAAVRRHTMSDPALGYDPRRVSLWRILNFELWNRGIKDQAGALQLPTFTEVLRDEFESGPARHTV